MEIKKIAVGCCALFCMVAPQALAQDGSIISGIVSDRQNGKPLEMANVTLRQIPGDHVAGTTTDGNGYYEFAEVSAGRYIFKVQYIGYETYADTLTLDGDRQSILKNVRMSRTSERLREVTVSGVREDVEAGKVSIGAKELRRAPTPAASADLASYLQTQPGVVATGDRGGQLFVRGGTPSENMVLVDGSIVYRPFHILGFFSLFPEDIVSSVDFYAGGFGAEYSGRTSSVMDIKLKNANLYETQWSASVSPFLGGMMFQSPVNRGQNSVLVSLRGSLVEESSSYYLPEQQPLRFNSQLVKFSSVGDHVSCTSHFIRTYDRGKLNFEAEDFFKWSNVVVGGRCFGVSQGASDVFFDMNVGVSYFSNEAGSTSGRGRYSNLYKLNVDVNFIQSVLSSRIEYGFSTAYRSLNYDISERFLATQESTDSFLSSSLYLAMKIPWGEKFAVEPGFSAATYLGSVKASLEPRLQLSWQPRGRVDEEVHAALGVYHQPLVGVSDFRDAGTAFTAWMKMPEQGRKMKARHALLGWNQPLGTYLDLSLEGYHKQLQNIPISVWSPVAQFSTELAYADGTIHGADLRLDFDHRNFYASLGYGYSLTEYETMQEHFESWFGEAAQSYHPPHDRRHQLNLQAGVELGNFTANVSWMYGTGLPFTRPLGFDSFFNFEDRPPDVTDNYGNPRILMEKPFKGRLPDFHRLDVSVEQAIDFTSSVRLRLQAGAVNAYNWQNLFFYDVFKQEGVNQLSFMPYVSLKMESL